MITAADIARYKSHAVKNTSLNGGYPGRTKLVHAKRHDIFPAVTTAERTNGRVLYRKLFVTNESPTNDTASNGLAYLLAPSPAGDRLALATGTQRDEQGDISGDAGVCWHGVGQLATALSGGETSIVLNMGAADYGFINGGYIRLSSQYLASQTEASDVRPDNSVTLDAGTWKRRATTTDVTHPIGIWCGNGLVHTLHASSNMETIQLADLLREDEVIGTGDGSTSPALNALADATNGVAAFHGLEAVVTATCGGVTRTATIGADGLASGYCSAGELDLDAGTWTTPIVWTVAPDTGTDITITYRERCYSRAGNQYTIALHAQVMNAYATAATYGASCLYQAELVPSVDNVVVVSASGAFDHAGHPITAPCLGSEEETWVITFTGATTFTCAGLLRGVTVGTGTTGADFSPENAATGSAYFTVPAAAFGGAWQAGDTLTFQTHRAALPVWIRQIVPAGMSNAYGLVLWGTQVE